ncbi:ankyrin repeat domain-containing protein [Candidatus Babeliales bacterium]|nr:ankyrin repeat domain-containing protein [Candidatus Babeliales bacterium]
MKKFIGLFFVFTLALTTHVMPAASSSSSSSTNDAQQARISSWERISGRSSRLGRNILALGGCRVRIPYDFDILYAAEEGNVQELRSLIAQGFNINYVDRFGCGSGRTALHAAAGNGHTACVQILTTHGANVNALCNNQETPLTIAIHSGNMAAIKLLIDAGANKEHKTANGETALQRAKRLNKSKEIIKLLKSSTTKRQRTNTSPNSDQILMPLLAFPGNDELIDDDIYGTDALISLPSTSSSSSEHTSATSSKKRTRTEEQSKENPYILKINYGEIDNKEISNWIKNPRAPWSVSGEELD